jgi:hypothetical protein
VNGNILSICVLGLLFLSCQHCELVYDYPSSYCLESDYAIPLESFPSKPLLKKEALIPELERKTEESLSIPSSDEIVPEEPSIPSGKITRRIQKPKPYGLVIPFTELCPKKEDEEESSLNSAIDWAKISPWIYKTS